MMNNQGYIPILATKLFVPHSSGVLIDRPRLVEGLLRALECKVTVVSAPPGYGKSSLLSEWVNQLQVPVGWLSMESTDNDVIRFWVYVIAALQKVRPRLGSQALALLHTQPDLENVMTLLVNDLITVEEDIVLVLDDYHVIEEPEVHRSMMLFIGRLPANMHVCLASRKDVPLSLGSLRVKGQLYEIGISDLRFTSDEIRTYWNKQVGIEPNDSLLRILEQRTEGWVAGLKLAALFGGGQSAASADISIFSGRHRYVVDYLLEEAFLHLPEQIQKFLLQTSILERMNSSLCSAVTGEESASLLNWLEQANLFLIPLDNERFWYRYHHLFSEFLEERLRKQAAPDISQLHLKASKWYEKQQFIYEAVHHAIRAEEYERASWLIEKHAASFLKRRELVTLNKWVEQLPEGIANRANLLIIKVWTTLLVGDVKMTLELLAFLHEKIKVDEDQLSEGFVSRIWEETYIINNFLALFRKDFEDAYQRMEWMTGRNDINEIRPQLDREVFLVDGIELNAGYSAITQGFYGFFGRLKQAEAYHLLYSQFLEKNDMMDYHFTANNFGALCEVYYEKNECSRSREIGKKGCSIALRKGNIGAYVPASITIARTYWVEGKQDKAIEYVEAALDTLHQLGEEHYSRWHHFYHAYLTRCYIVQGNEVKVEQWLQSTRLSSSRELTIYQEYENFTLLRVMMHRQQYEEGLILAKSMLKVAEQSRQIGSILENLLMLAAFLHALGDLHQAALRLHDALLLAESEGYFRTILDEGPILFGMMSKYMEFRKYHLIPALHNGVSLRYVEKLYILMGNEKANWVETKTAINELVSPLTKRELEVLGLVAQGMSNKEIAENLALSEGTIKLHLNRIYSKLMCNNRLQALQKAKQLHLLP